MVGSGFKARAYLPRIHFLQFKKMNHLSTRQILTAATLALTLAGCGGGGSDAAWPAPDPIPTPVPVPTAAALQGIWQSMEGASSTSSAVVLPDGKLWAITTHGGVTRLLKASLSVQTAGFSGTGKSYTLGGNAATNGVSATATANVVEKTRLAGAFTVTGGQAEAFSLAYQTRYDTPTVVSDYAGAWQATLGPGVVNWTIGSTGTISGTRTTGCTYSGQLTLRAEQKAVLNAAIAETCAGAVVQLDGVAVFNADKTRITLLMTTADESTAVAVNLGR